MRSFETNLRSVACQHDCHRIMVHIESFKACFDRRTATGSGRVAFMSRGFAQIFK